MRLWQWCIVLCVALGFAVAPARAVTLERDSVSSTGAQADAASETTVLSEDGRYVAFDSLATNLVPKVTNGTWNVYVRDRQTGTVERVSMGILGEPDGPSRFPAISADGRYVAFVSSATNLVLNDNNGADDIFVRDRQTETTTRVSVSTTNFEANGPSLSPWISADGRRVVFASAASNLVTGDTNGAQDIFLRDLNTGQTTRVSVSSTGAEANAPSSMPVISGDGNFVAFASSATNLVTGDTNAMQDIFVRDLTQQKTERVSVATDGTDPDGTSEWPAISAEGRFVAFSSVATNLVPDDINDVADIFVYDRQLGETSAVTPVDVTTGAGDSVTPAISDDGRFVTYASLSSSLVTRDRNDLADVFLTDRILQRTLRMSEAVDGTEANNQSLFPSISGDGLVVGFASTATNLVPNDTNGVSDVFTRQWVTFSDVPPDAFGFVEIEGVYQAGIVQGFPGGLYEPKVVVTRDQMAAFIARAVAGGDAKVPAGPTSATFTDVSTDYWAFRYIEYVADKHIVQGYPDGGYHPTESVDRAQMAVFIARAIAGGDSLVPSGPAEPDFPDVPTTFWAYNHIEYLHLRGVVQGFPDGDYHPEVLVTRDQMAVFIYRAFKLTLKSLSVEAAPPEEVRAARAR